MSIDTRARQASTRLHAEVARRFPTPPTPRRSEAHRRRAVKIAAACASLGAALVVARAARPRTTATSHVTATNAWALAIPGRYDVHFSANGAADIAGSVMVDPPNGSEQHHHLTVGPESRPAGASDWTTLTTTTGVYVQQITLIGPSWTVTYQPGRPAPYISDGRAGKAWSWTATSLDGRHALRSDTRLLRHDTLTVAGRTVDAIVLRSELSDPTIDYHEATTAWYAPAYGLVLREQGTQPASRGAPAVDWTMELPSPLPVQP